MLNKARPIATVAVRDLDKARSFYEAKLGLAPPADQSSETAFYEDASVQLLLYRSAENAGTNKATTVTWFVGENIAAVVKSLRENGVTFENYDFPGAEKDGDIFIFGEIRNAWFKDPDGNIHSVVNG